MQFWQTNNLLLNNNIYTISVFFANSKNGKKIDLKLLLKRNVTKSKKTTFILHKHNKIIKMLNKKKYFKPFFLNSLSITGNFKKYFRNIRNIFVKMMRINFFRKKISLLFYITMKYIKFKNKIKKIGNILKKKSKNKIKIRAYRYHYKSYCPLQNRWKKKISKFLKKKRIYILNRLSLKELNTNDIYKKKNVWKNIYIFYKKNKYPKNFSTKYPKNFTTKFQRVLYKNKKYPRIFQHILYKNKKYPKKFHHIFYYFKKYRKYFYKKKKKTVINYYFYKKFYKRLNVVYKPNFWHYRKIKHIYFKNFLPKTKLTDKLIYKTTAFLDIWKKLLFMFTQKLKKERSFLKIARSLRYRFYNYFKSKLLRIISKLSKHEIAHMFNLLKYKNLYDCLAFYKAKKNYYKLTKSKITKSKITKSKITKSKITKFKLNKSKFNNSKLITETHSLPINDSFEKNYIVFKVRNHDKFKKVECILNKYINKNKYKFTIFKDILHKFNIIKRKTKNSFAKKDSFYNSLWLEKFINKFMRKGKKFVVEKNIQILLLRIKHKRLTSPINIFFTMIFKLKPVYMLVKKKLGLKTIEVPFPLRARRQFIVSLNFLNKQIIRHYKRPRHQGLRIKNSIYRLGLSSMTKYFYSFIENKNNNLTRQKNAYLNKIVDKRFFRYYRW